MYFQGVGCEMNFFASDHLMMKLQMCSHRRLVRCGASTGLGVWVWGRTGKMGAVLIKGRERHGALGLPESQFETSASNDSKDGFLPPGTVHD